MSASSKYAALIADARDFYPHRDGYARQLAAALESTLVEVAELKQSHRDCAAWDNVSGETQKMLGEALVFVREERDRERDMRWKAEAEVARLEAQVAGAQRAWDAIAGHTEAGDA